MKKIYLLLFAILFFAGSGFAQVSVTATTGTPGPTVYTTLQSAFDAINLGTHQGSITVSITGNTTETAPCVLNSSGAGAAAYTAIIIKPTIAATISGPTTTGRGLIELNGADNVTIDGSITTGTRDLTITNTAANTISYTMAVRIAVAATVVTSANNCVIKNLIVNGSATGRNISTATSTTGSEATTYGIYAGGGASTVAATTAPSPIASVSTTAGAGSTINGLTITNNFVNACARGIAVQGGAISVIDNLTINNNLLGAATAGSLTTVYRSGITAQGFTAALISSNVIRNNEWWVGTSSPALSIGDVSANGTNAVIENNIITHKVASSTGTFGAYGINLAAGNGATVRNNFVSDVTADMTGGAAFSTTFGIFGIRVAAGLNHKIYHNSVNLFGLRSGTPATNLLSAAFGITGTGLTGCDVRNNIFSNNITGGTTSIANVSIFLPSGGTVTMNLTINNNAYYNAGTAGNSGVAHGGVTYTSPVTTAGTGLYENSNFNPAATTPVTNLRNYTSTLSAAGTNDNASLGIAGTPPFTSTTDLHIPAATPSPLESGGAVTTVLVDIDGDTRPGPTGSVNGGGTLPDIGADEFDGILASDVTPPSIVYTALPAGTCTAGNQTLTATITDASGVPTSGTGLPVLYYRINSGAYTPVTGVSIGSNQFTFTFGAAAVSGDIVQYYVVAQDNASTPNVGSNPSAGAGGFTANPPAASTPPASPSFFVFGAALGGTYSVGAGGNYSTLTAAIASYNAACSITAPIVFSLTDATYPSETYPIVINVNSGANATNTLTIVPAAGVSPLISGSNTSPLIKLNGADFVIINGSNNGTTSRNLTIENTNAAGSGVVWIASTATDGATNNAIRNTIIRGLSGTATTGDIILSGSVLGAAAEVSNNNIVFNNNLLTRAVNGIYAIGNATIPDQGWNFSMNNIGSSVAADKIGFRGIAVQNTAGFIVNQNTILGVTTSSTSTATGIAVFGVINGGAVSRNNISDIKNTNAVGYGAVGIYLVSSSAASAVVTSNNFIFDIAGVGYATTALAADNGNGIFVESGGGYSIYYNTVNLNTNQTLVGVPAAINIGVGVTAAGAIDLRDNIFVNNETQTGERYAIYSSAPNTVFSNIDYNDYFTTGADLGFIGSNRVTLADIQAGFGGNVNSKNYNPVFLSATDLHLDGSNAANIVNLGDQGVAVSITYDFDGQSRPIPDLGADEFNAAGALPVSIEFFRGSKQGAANFLDWKVTCTSAPSLRIILERSADGFNFTPIQTQTATAVRCLQGFNYTDHDILKGANYYMLKTITPDGTVRVSNIVLLMNDGSIPQTISMAPNPVRSNTVLTVMAAKAGQMNIAVSDMYGRIVAKQIVTLIAGSNTINMNFGNLAAGLYNVTLSGSGSDTQRTRFMKD